MRGRNFSKAHRRTPGELNSNEEQYRLILEERKQKGEIIDFYPQPLKIRLSDTCTYTPDFMVVEADLLLTFVEVKDEWNIKGKKQIHWEEDAKIKFKWLMDKYPCFHYIVAVHTKEGFREVEMSE